MTKKESDGVASDDLVSTVTQPQPNCFRMSWTAEWRKSIQEVLSICGNSFKTVEKAFHMKLLERMPRVCKAVIKAKGGYFEESKIYSILICLILFWILHDSICVIS